MLKKLFYEITKKFREDRYLIFIPILTIGVRTIVFLIVPLTYEDAYITFRYAENFADGLGLVYNEGERVYGTTTPLFALLLGVFKYIGVSCVVSSLIINLVSESITSLIVYKILKEYSNDIISLIITLLFIFSPSNISWSIQGMETGFFSVIIAISFYAYYINRYSTALFFASLSALIRIDGFSVVFLIYLFIIVKQKRILVKQILYPLFLIASWYLFLFLYYGSAIPNSMIAKLILYSGHQSSMYPNLELVLSKFFSAGYYSSSILSLFFLLGVIIVIYRKRNLTAMITWFFTYYLALIISKTHIHGWYFIPPLFAFITIAGLGIIFFRNQIIHYSTIKKLYIDSFLTLFLLLFSYYSLGLKIMQLKDEFQYEQNVRIKIGNYLRMETPNNSSIFLEPIGIIGYYSERYIYDDSGLVTPIFHELNKYPNIPKTVFKKIELVKPDFLVLRNPDLKEFFTTTELLKNYKIIKEFSYDRGTEYPGFTIFERR